MLSARVIPCLLLKNGGLVKTRLFKKPVYVGDPINVVRIFNDKEADELILLDIDATKEGRETDFQLLEKITAQCFMPVAFGGGIRSVEQARQLFMLGIEKVIVNTAAVETPELISELSQTFGAQAVVVAIDVGKRMFSGRREVFIRSGRKATGLDPAAHARNMERLGAGEILINAIYKDGTMTGYDIGLIEEIRASVDIPIIASGGANSIDDLALAIQKGGATASAAGAMFVYQARDAGVLISYVNRVQLLQKMNTMAKDETV